MTVKIVDDTASVTWIPDSKGRYRSILLQLGVPDGILTRMVWLPDSEKILKIWLLILTQHPNATDRHHMTTQTALMHGIAQQKSWCSVTESTIHVPEWKIRYL